MNKKSKDVISQVDLEGVVEHNTFRERGLIIHETIEKHDWSITEMAEKAGVTDSTVHRWIEPMRDFWKDSEIDPRTENTVRFVDELPVEVIRSARYAASDSSEAMEYLNLIYELDLSESDVRTAYREYQHGKGFEEALHSVHTEKNEPEISVELRFQITGDEADMIMNMASARHESSSEIARKMLMEKLSKERRWQSMIENKEGGVRR